MKDTKRYWGRTLFLVIALIAILSILLTACGPADEGLSGAAGGNKTPKANQGQGQGQGQGGQGGQGGDGGQGGSGGGQGGQGSGGGTAKETPKPPKEEKTPKPSPHETDTSGVIKRCVENPSDPACKNPLPTGCNANNPKNCPNPPEICGLGKHVGNPHCKTPTPPPTEPVCTTPPCETPTPTNTPTPTATPNIEINIGPKACQNWIAFHSLRTDNMEVFRLDGVEGATGARLINLSNSTATDSRPSRSPNDKLVVFQSDRDGNVELYLTDSEGKGQSRLTKTQANNEDPMFSPDNQHVVYNSDRNGTWDLYLIDTKTGVETQLTSNNGDNLYPYWSPDSDWLVFQSNRTGRWNIYLLNISTGTEYTFTDFTYDAQYPSWSPNGKQIAFLANWANAWYLYVTDLDGNNVQQITKANTANVAWSPEGDRIAYQVDDAQGSPDVYTYDLPNKKEYKLTKFEGLDAAPSWDCAGANVSFTSLSGGSLNVYSVPWQGGTITYITNNPKTNKWSEWSPSKEPASRSE